MRMKPAGSFLPGMRNLAITPSDKTNDNRPDDTHGGAPPGKDPAHTRRYALRLERRAAHEHDERTRQTNVDEEQQAGAPEVRSSITPMRRRYQAHSHDEPPNQPNCTQRRRSTKHHQGEDDEPSGAGDEPGNREEFWHRTD